MVQFVDQETQDEFKKVDNEFVKNAGGILIDGSNLVQLKNRWVDDDQIMSNEEVDNMVNEVGPKEFRLKRKIEMGHASLNDFDGMNFSQTVGAIKRMDQEWSILLFKLI